MILKKRDIKTKQEILTSLNNGEVIILPCDTIYGLCGKVDISFSNLASFKGRPDGKPFIQLATKQMVMDRCIDIPEKLFEIWPAPLTAILNTKHGTVGFRVPKDPFLLDIISDLGSPIYSTSVNFSGEPSLTSFEEIVNRFSHKEMLIIKGDDNQGTISSTIIDCTKAPYKILRAGAYNIEMSGLNFEVFPK